MSSDLNNVTMLGRLTRDVEIKDAGKSKIAKFSIANNRFYMSGDEKKNEASFFECIAWGKTGEFIHQYGKKGDRVAISGRLQQKTWTDKEGKNRSTCEIVVENLQLLNNKETAQKNIEQKIVETFQSFGDAPF